MYDIAIYRWQMSLSVSKVKMHWVNDDERSACMACNAPFGVMRRRHHCRFCGEIFCADCCQQKLTSKSICLFLS